MTYHTDVERHAVGRVLEILAAAGITVAVATPDDGGNGFCARITSIQRCTDAGSIIYLPCTEEDTPTAWSPNGLLDAILYAVAVAVTVDPYHWQQKEPAP